jgi:nucleoid-associated protein YgaU
MDVLLRSARVVGTVAVEAATLAALVAIGGRPGMGVPLGDLGDWLRDGDPATVVVALLRWVAVVLAAWTLLSTLLYLAAASSRVPAAVRAVRWTTVPAVRRVVDAACAVSVATSVVATSVVLAPAGAGATSADPPSVSVVRDGRGGDGSIARLPADPAPTTTRPAPVPPAPTVVVPDDDVVVVDAGDNLWVLAARRLARASGRTPDEVTDAEVAPYWVRVCDANRARLASSDPDLVFPGEQVVLPPV